MSSKLNDDYSGAAVAEDDGAEYVNKVEIIHTRRLSYMK